MPHINEIINCLRSENVQVQLNAAAYLQHVTYQNEDNKETIRKKKAIPALISMLSSRSSTCQLNAASVLRNLSNGSNIQIKNEIQKCGGIEIIDSLLDNSHQLDRRFTETIIAILCNLSSNLVFQVHMVTSILQKVVEGVFLPFLGIKIYQNSMTIIPFKSSELSFTYDSFLEYITAFIKNLSSGSQYIRQKLRNKVGLVDSIIAIIEHSHMNGNIHSNIVEHCACIVRNLCYALQEVIDPDYLTKRSVSDSTPVKNGKKRGSVFRNSGNSSSSKEILMSPRSTGSNPSVSGVALLWTDSIIDVLLLLINDSYNYSTIEAAIGAVQNLAACDWQHAEQFRYNFRKKKGLPSLVIQMNNGPDSVIKIAIAAFRNLGQDSRNLDLIGKHCLYHLIRLLPNDSIPIVKRIAVTGSESNEVELPEEYLGLYTIYSVLSLIYFILRSDQGFCKEFVEINGIRCCMYMLRSDHFYKEHLMNCSPIQSENADKIPILCAGILQLLWSNSEIAPSLKKDKWTCEDFCVQTIASELKSSLSCSQKEAVNSGSVYYGKPYVKARTNGLIPWTFKFSQRQPIIAKTTDRNESLIDDASFHQNSVMPNFFIESADNELSPSTSIQKPYINHGYSQDKLFPEREVITPRQQSLNGNPRTRKEIRNF